MVEINLSTSSPLFGKIEISKEIVKISSEVEGQFVVLDEYEFDVTDSPLHTQEDLQSTSTAVREFVGDPLKQIRSLERLELIEPGVYTCGCYIAPQAYFAEYKTDPNNIIWGSSCFHMYFDGDGKRRPVGEDVSWGTPPSFSIQFDIVGESLVYLNETFHKVFVFLKFLDDEKARTLSARMRDGSSVIDNLTLRSFFFTTNIENCQKYLALKQQEAELRWADDPVEQI